MDKIRKAVRVLELRDLEKYKVDFIDEQGFFKFILEMENERNIETMRLNRRGGNGLFPAHIDIMGYFGETSMEFFRKYTSIVESEKPHFRIISHFLKPSEERIRDIQSLQFLRKLKKLNIDIRVNYRAHSRLFIYYLKKDGEVLHYEGRLVLGSFDFNKEGLGRGEHRDAGIKTHHPDLIVSAVNYFDSIWNDEDYTRPLDEMYPP